MRWCKKQKEKKTVEAVEEAKDMRSETDLWRNVRDFCLVSQIPYPQSKQTKISRMQSFYVSRDTNEHNIGCLPLELKTLKNIWSTD